MTRSQGMTHGVGATAAAAAHGAISPRALTETIDRTRLWLLEHQHADGYWCGELEGDSILQSEYILLLAFLGREGTPVARRAAQQLLVQQRADGSWGQYPGSAIDISASVKAYFALKLTGHDPAAEYMQRARDAIRAAGGADAVNSFTRFYLALLGQISYDHCPAVPPEAVLLPTWAPINIYRISAWSRTILVPLAIMWAHRPVTQIEPERGIQELFLREPRDWPPLRCPGLESRGWIRWEAIFRTLDRTLKLCERWRLRPLRRRALRAAEKWMTDRFVDSDGLGAIFPPIIWSIVALKCLGYDDRSTEVRYCHEELEALAIDEGDTRRLEPCKSPVWDTAIALRALAAAGVRPEDPAARRAIHWLIAKEVRRAGDWSVRAQAEPAGWFFEHHNEFYPDVDDTAMVMMALREAFAATAYLDPMSQGASTIVAVGKSTGASSARSRVAWFAEAASSCGRARKWVLAMQNRDGGWGAFDRDNDAEFLCHVPFADHNAMIDPSTPDLTARVLEALGGWGMKVGQGPVDRAVAYLRSTQEDDGSWFGRWGVNYLYGVWQTLVGLEAVGVGRRDPMVERGAAWLLAVQNADGGWGETADSYENPLLKGQGPSTASQTAWALWGLMAAGLTHHEAVRRGVAWLIERQQADGSWRETEFTGTGFPRVFYLRYHLYPIYFPLLALARYERETRRE